ncbi:MAG TPA: hypothetical protein VHY22_05960 [Chthoniobacteraceae bacterium]|jgi:hypothetical protein|nr:hypothetical protein [Chthoniobacteraceae bacterium]
MFKSLANLIPKKPAPPPLPSRPVSPFAAPSGQVPHGEEREIGAEHAPIYQSLAMTEELREALFPTTPQMVSAIFERSAPAEAPPPPAPEDVQKQLQQLQQQIRQIQKGAGDNGSFPIV